MYARVPGRALVIIYPNDLSQVLINLCIHVSLYAGDTAIYYPSADTKGIEIMLQEDLLLI